MTTPVPWTSLTPHEDAADIETAIRRVLNRGWFVLGPEVEGFEAEFAAATGSRHAVAVASGTDALMLILRALGLNSGDEVITTALSAVYTAQAVMMTGAVPVFADIEPRRLTLDLNQVEALICPRTAAILPVHLYGQPAPVDELAALAGRHGLALVEDCCQAHLATCNGVPVGTRGAAAAYSFYPTKNLGALGDGGAVCTDDGDLADRIRQLRNGGQTRRDHHTEVAGHSRLDELHAAVLRARLPHLADWTRRRRVIAGRYRAGLSTSPVRVPPELDAGHVYHLFPVLTDRRDQLRNHLRQREIASLIHYPVPMSAQPAFASVSPAPSPVAQRVCDELLSLPLYPALADDDVTRVIDAVCAWPVT